MTRGIGEVAVRGWGGGSELRHFVTGVCQGGKDYITTDHGTTDHGLRGRGRERDFNHEIQGKGTLGHWEQGTGAE